MNVLKFNIESWWSILKNLNNDIKLELATRLLESMKKTTPPLDGNDGWKQLAGAWNDETATAEEIITLIKDSRLSNRQIDSLD